MAMRPPPSPPRTTQVAQTFRFLSADGVQAANSGHPGLPMGCADIAAVLFTRFWNIDPNDPQWFARDRFVLSAGHGSMLLYSMLFGAGLLTLEDLKRFRQLGSHTPGHPEYGDTPGVDMTAGPLGAGFASAVGMALAERMAAERYDTPKFEVVDHFTYVLMGDGCHMEGVTQEAASFAGHHQLGRLIAIYDDNRITIEGGTGLTFSEDVGKRYEAMNWHVQHCDGHDHEAVAAAIAAAQEVRHQPSLIIARTTIGYGAPKKAGTAGCHGEPLGQDELAAAKASQGWPADPFHVPAEVERYFVRRREEWEDNRKEWNALFDQYERKHRAIARELKRVMAGELPLQWKKALPEFPAGKALASRASGGTAMNALGEVLPELVGGSADLAPSTKTEIKTGDHPEFVAPGRYLGRNIHFGVREHAMGNIVNGLALHGGFVPFGATFLVFHDYMRPTLRLAALMKIRSIFVYTHDSLHVGEDGPTHQPVEHLAALRAIPHLDVWRPADANEVSFAWQAAVERKNGPSAIALTRQNLPTYERPAAVAGQAVNGLARDTLKGGYILSEDAGRAADILLVATGSEVALAMDVAAKLREKGKAVRVVSMPCVEVFKRQAEGYRKKVLPKRLRKRVVLEAGIVQGWEGIMGELGLFVGMEGFGASGPADQVAAKFGFTVDAVMAKIEAAGYLNAPPPGAGFAARKDDEIETETEADS